MLSLAAPGTRGKMRRARTRLWDGKFRPSIVEIVVRLVNSELRTQRYHHQLAGAETRNHYHRHYSSTPKPPLGAITSAATTQIFTPRKFYFSIIKYGRFLVDEVPVVGDIETGGPAEWHRGEFKEGVVKTGFEEENGGAGWLESQASSEGAAGCAATTDNEIVGIVQGMFAEGF